MDWKKTIDGLAAKVAETAPGEQAGDYRVDGLLYCGKCKTAKQCRVTVFGAEQTVCCLCKCEAERRKKEDEAREAAQMAEKARLQIAKNRHLSFPESDMGNWTFAADDGKDAQTIKAMRAYVENFEQFRQQGKGLLLYGPCGTGKTFAAACVVNALLEKGYPCLMTNFSRIANTISGMFEGKQDYLDSINKNALLVLDDLGAERSTEYMTEIVYNIIDARYRANRPMIITSNLTGEDLKNPKNIAEQRVFNRVLEKCHPVYVGGSDRRRHKIKAEFDDMKALLGL